MVKSFSLNFVKKVTSFMTEALSYRNLTTGLKSKSMDWFLDDKHLPYESVKCILKNLMKIKRITNYVLLCSFCMSLFPNTKENKFPVKC